MSNVKVNEQVNITSLGFRKNMAAYPKRMEYKGKTYEFVDAGLRCLIRTGGMIAEIVTMSDGLTNFQLRTDNRGGQWTLLSILS